MNKKQTVFSLLCGLMFSMIACQKESVFEVSQIPNAFSSTPSLLSSSYSLNNWMASLNGSYPLSRFSIPGSHDAAARFELVSGTAICQNLSIPDQLNAGVRFLDIRCRHYYNAFVIYHGAVYQKITFGDVVKACIHFLKNNPSECIIMSVKEEYSSTGSTRSFESTFESYISRNPGFWYLGEGIPALKTVRGKIVLLRRFYSFKTIKGIDASGWAPNSTFSISNASAQLRIQDHYEVSDNSVKWRAITNFITEAKSGNMDVLYMNFTSGYKPLIFGIPDIPSVSKTVNSKEVSYVASISRGRLGIIASDFSCAEKSSQIIRTNF